MDNKNIENKEKLDLEFKELRKQLSNPCETKPINKKPFEIKGWYQDSDSDLVGRIKEIIALRNQLIEHLKKIHAVDHPKDFDEHDILSISRGFYNILINDWEKTTDKWFEKLELQKKRRKSWIIKKK